MKAVEGCDGLLVVGSSLMVYSAFRLARAAAASGAQLALLSVGPTRADDLASVKVRDDITVLRADQLCSALPGVTLCFALLHRPWELTSGELASDASLLVMRLLLPFPLLAGPPAGTEPNRTFPQVNLVGSRLRCRQSPVHGECRCRV